MPKVLFSHSYFYPLDKKQWRISEPYPPLMTITAAAYLREAGMDIDLFDVCLRDSEAGLEEKLTTYQPDYFVIFDDGFNYLTKMCLTTMREAAFRMQGMAKGRGVKVITCSSDSTDHFQSYLEAGADYVIRGEGETTLLALIRLLEEGAPDEIKVKNLAYLGTNGEPVLTPKGPVLNDLDHLPQAAWDLVDIERYKSLWNARGKKYFINLATTRGCPYKCNWCAKPIYGNRYNSRSVSRAVDEIEYHVNHHGVDHFWVCDDIFGLKPGWVQEFDQELKKRDLVIKYKIQSRADLLLKEDNIQALISSGLYEAWIGAESGSQRILDAMDKGTTVEQIEQSTRLLKKGGVRVAFFIQFGYLGETWKEVKETISLILRMMPDRLGISVSYPLPGTKFYDKVKDDLQLKANWTDSDDLDMMFENTYSKQFYKLLHRYVHNRYAIRKGLIAGFHLIRNPIKRPVKHLRTVIRAIVNIGKIVVNGLKLSYARNFG